MSDPLMKLQKISRIYNKGQENALPVLKDVDFEVHAGELVGLVGPSGSGKSTFLHMAGLLEKPDGGEVYIGGRATVALTDKERTELRRTHLGFVYQFHHLLPEFNALENIEIPQFVAGVSREAAAERAKELLTHLGLADRMDHRPGQLSGGEQQRVAIARALANRPKILMADEPTGNLDPKTADLVFDEFLRLVREENLAAIVATHNMSLADKMDRVVVLEDGQLRER